MVDRAWLARLLRRVRADSALPRASRELSDVAANDLTRDVVEIAFRGGCCLFAGRQVQIQDSVLNNV
jgi:hypothetical protein